MKKALKVMAMLLFVVSMTALTSCNKQAENLIIGKWQCTTANYTDEGTTYPIPEVVGMTWEFKANGDLIATASLDGVNNTATVTYVILGNVLTVTSVDYDGEIDTEAYDIKELTKSKLVLEQTDDWDETLVIEFKKI